MKKKLGNKEKKIEKKSWEQEAEDDCKPPDNGWVLVIYGVGSMCLSFTHPYDIEKTTKGMLRFFEL